MNKEKWEIKKLEEVAQITMGQSPTSDTYNEEGNGIPFFQGNVDFGKTYPKIRVFTTKPTKIVGTNELLISVRAPIGAINISNCECCIGRGLAGIKPKENSLDLGFLTYTLKFHSQNLQEKGTGSTFKAINKNILTDLEIPIPPLSTQEKIVSELDTLHRLKELQEQQLAELDNLAQSTFYHLFGDPIENEKGWEVKKLGEVCENLFAGGDVPKNNMSIEKTTKFHIPIYTNGIKDDGLYGYTDYARVNKRSLTISSRGTIGYIVLRNEPFFPAIRLIVVTPKHFMNCNFVMKALQNMDIKSSGTSIPQLTVPDLKNKIIILPPLSLQTHFSERIEKIEAQKELIKQSIGETEQLIGYTMDKYFG